MSNWLVFPNQLFEVFLTFPAKTRFFIVEHPLFYGKDRYFFHSKQRLVYTRACIQGFMKELKQSHENVQLIEYSKAEQWLEQNVNSSFSAYDPVDFAINKHIKALGVDIKATPMFFCSTQDFDEYEAQVAHKFFQTNFYKFMRSKFGVLLCKDGSYKGGKLSFDTENRKSLPKGTKIPAFKIKDEESEKLIKSSVDYVEKTFPNAQGSVGEIVFPVTREASYKHFERFLQERFKEFGPYQDAFTAKDLVLFHAGISPMVNNGLLDVKKVVKMASETKVPIASQEGFIRQIVGWREFVRYVYVRQGEEIRSSNILNNCKAIDNRFYSGFGIPMLDAAISMCINYGYCHHIMRLMLISNFMLLCRIHNSEMIRWYMELCHDAYDWVMVPNVYGMGYSSDLMTTKPYISGSNYVLKMSGNVGKNDKWVHLWDALFYAFLHRQQENLKNNHRMSLMFANLRKKENIDELVKEATEFIETFPDYKK